MHEAEQLKQDDSRQTVRVPFPARVEFAGECFSIQEFTANLSESGIFLPTDVSVPPGTRGTLTFRLTQWDRPFTVEAEVVRNLTESEQSHGRHSGLGIRFLDLTDTDLERLRRLVEGVRDGSVVQSIRRSIRESGRGLDQELRMRPLDQRLILASFASGEEINALIRGGHASVVARLLKNPRLRLPHVRQILRNARLPIPVLVDVKKHKEWMVDEEVRQVFCKHPNAPLQDVLSILPMLPTPRIQQLALEQGLRPQIRQKVLDLRRQRRR